MSEPKKRFGRSRKSQDDTQDFALTERDRELAALAAEILPRNSAAASFELGSPKAVSGVRTPTRIRDIESPSRHSVICVKRDDRR